MNGFTHTLVSKSLVKMLLLLITNGFVCLSDNCIEKNVFFILRLSGNFQVQMKTFPKFQCWRRILDLAVDG